MCRVTEKAAKKNKAKEQPFGAVPLLVNIFWKAYAFEGGTGMKRLHEMHLTKSGAQASDGSFPVSMSVLILLSVGGFNGIGKLLTAVAAVAHANLTRSSSLISLAMP